MWDFMKKMLAFGIGVAAITMDKAKQMVDEAVARGEVSKEDARKFLEDLRVSADKETHSIQAWIREQVKRAITEAGGADAERVAGLEQRVAVLEARLGVPKEEEAEAKAPQPVPE